MASEQAAEGFSAGWAFGLVALRGIILEGAAQDWSLAGLGVWGLENPGEFVAKRSRRYTGGFPHEACPGRS